MELISVIVPVYNVERYLKRCIESILNQTYRNLEIILVDDESPDNCPLICEEMMREDSRIKVIHKKNGGLGLARNSGLDLANGYYVTFIDSDDWISPNHIESLYSAILEANAEVAIGEYTNVSASGTYELRPVLLKKGMYEDADIIDGVVLPMIGPDANCPNDVQISSSVCTNLYRMDLIKRNGLRFISERFAVAEDLYFNIDVLCHTKRLVVTDEVGYYYFENNASISRKYNPKRFERTLNFYPKVLEQVSRYNLCDRIGHRIERTYLVKVRIAIRHISLSDLRLKKKLSEIKTILEHDTTVSVLRNYPMHTMIPAMRLLTKLMRSRNVTGVYLLMRMRESARNTNFLKAILKELGIGK